MDFYNSTVSYINSFLKQVNSHYNQASGQTDFDWFSRKLEDFILTLKDKLEKRGVSTDKCPSNTSDMSGTDQTVPCESVDPSLVQIRVSKLEIEKRISAFIERKQCDVDNINRREFCSIIDEAKETSSSCARTDAVFQPRMGTMSHVKVTKTNNTFGPQTRYPTTETTYDSRLSGNVVKREPLSNEMSGHSRLPSGIDERLRNMEDQLSIYQDGEVKASLYERLGKLESRILDLESTSPEYIHCLPSAPKRSKQLSSHAGLADQNLNVSEIDITIRQLKQSLLNKARQRMS